MSGENIVHYKRNDKEAYVIISGDSKGEVFCKLKAHVEEFHDETWNDKYHIFCDYSDLDIYSHIEIEALRAYAEAEIY